MNPTPRTLVLLMSAVGLGLSLADAAWANEQAPADAMAEPATPLWVEEPRAQPSGGLDEYQAVDHDRHAVALALVLMADPPVARLARIVTSRKAWATAMARHLKYERVSEPIGLIATQTVATEPTSPELVAPELPHDDASGSAASVVDEASSFAGGVEPAATSVAMEAPATEVAFEMPVTATVGPATSAVDTEALAREAGVESIPDSAPAVVVAPPVDTGPTPERAIVVATPTAAAVDTPATQARAAGTETTTTTADSVAAAAAAATDSATAPAIDRPTEPVPAQAVVAPKQVVFKAAHFEVAPPPAETDAVASHYARHVLAALAELRASHPREGLLGKPASSEKAGVDRVLLDLLAVRTSRQAATTHAAVASNSAGAPAGGRTLDGVAPASLGEAPAHNPFGGNGLAVSAAKLDNVRGGFVTPGGLQLSFGIERAVYLNGNLVTTTSLQLNELGKVSGAQGLPVSAELSRALVQSGSGNTFVSNAVSAAALGTVIQNTLDNQKIQTITRIDAAVSAATVLRGIDLQSSMRGAISQSLQR